MKLDVIDTRTNSVIFWGKLHEGFSDASPIIVGSRLYIFGGYTNDAGYENVDYWQYFDLFGAFNLYSSLYIFRMPNNVILYNTTQDR